MESAQVASNQSRGARTLRLAGVGLLLDGLLSLLTGRSRIIGRLLPALDRGWHARLVGITEIASGLRVLGPVTVPDLYRWFSPVYDPADRLYRRVLHPEAFAAFDRALAERLPYRGSVLDLGCGTGGNLERLVTLGLPYGSYTGVDLSPHMLGRARGKFPSLPNIRYQQLDLLADPLPEGPFELIVSTNVFEHLPRAERVVAKALDRLRPGGTALLLFQADSGLGHSSAMKAYYRWFNARYLPEDEYRHFPGLESVRRFAGRNGAVNVLLELRRPSDAL